MRLAKASSPEAMSLMPDRSLPVASAATSRPSAVLPGLANASLCGFSTCRGRVEHPVRTRSNATAAKELRMDASYQAHFAPMQPRRIRSFVLRAGRVTAAQERALEEF